MRIHIYIYVCVCECVCVYVCVCARARAKTQEWVKGFAILCLYEARFGNVGCFCRGREGNNPRWTLRCRARLILSWCYSVDLPPWLGSLPRNQRF